MGQEPHQMPPVSRTYQYRKVMKPMLERKRRARINRCLDELKELMVVALQAEGENVSKLEKADILEFTVRHLHKLRKQEAEDGQKYKAGFTRCAAEVSQYLGNAPESRVSVLQHLSTCMRVIDSDGSTSSRDAHSPQNVQHPHHQQVHPHSPIPHHPHSPIPHHPHSPIPHSPISHHPHSPIPHHLHQIPPQSSSYIHDPVWRPW